MIKRTLHIQCIDIIGRKKATQLLIYSKYQKWCCILTNLPTISSIVPIHLDLGLKPVRFINMFINTSALTVYLSLLFIIHWNSSNYVSLFDYFIQLKYYLKNAYTNNIEFIFYLESCTLFIRLFYF